MRAGEATMFGFTFLPRMAETMIFSNSFFLNSLSEKFCASSTFMKALPVAAEVFADDLAHALLDEIIRQREFLLLERLHDQLAIDQILQRLLLRLPSIASDIPRRCIAAGAVRSRGPTTPRTCE